jgi:hypothetical protein
MFVMLFGLRSRSARMIFTSIIVGDIWMHILSGILGLLFSKSLTFDTGRYTFTNISFYNLNITSIYLRKLINDMPKLHIYFFTKFNELLMFYKLFTMLIGGLIFGSFQYWLCRRYPQWDQTLQRLLYTLNLSVYSTVVMHPWSGSCLFSHRPNLLCQRCKLFSCRNIFQLIHTNFYFSVKFLS